VTFIQKPYLRPVEIPKKIAIGIGKILTVKIEFHLLFFPKFRSVIDWEILSGKNKICQFLTYVGIRNVESPNKPNYSKL
jgi:hypothetical protein